MKKLEMSNDERTATRSVEDPVPAREHGDEGRGERRSLEFVDARPAVGILGEGSVFGGLAVAVSKTLAAELRDRAADGRLPCAVAFEIAETLGLPPLAVGEAANELGVKIVACQLGCFGEGKKP